MSVWERAIVARWAACQRTLQLAERIVTSSLCRHHLLSTQVELLPSGNQKLFHRVRRSMHPPTNSNLGRQHSPPKTSRSPAPANASAPNPSSRNKIKSLEGVVQWWKRWQTDWWTWELLSIAFSLGCLVAVLILLAVSNGHAVPELSYGLTVRSPLQ